VLESYLARLYKVERIGRVSSAPARYFAISVERRLKHLAVVAICEAARRALFAKSAPARRKRAREGRG
jgi:LysR family transcriptional activator of nhaA